MPQAITTETFVEACKRKHGDLYSYSKTQYVRSEDKITVTCNKCGTDFFPKAQAHKQGSGCPKCNLGRKARLTPEAFLQKVRAKWSDAYDLSSVNFQSYSQKVLITCPKHGQFEKTPANFLNGQGCPVCSGGRKTMPDLQPVSQSVSCALPVAFVEGFKAQVPENIWQRTKIQMLNSGVLNINITKSAHECWNLFVLPTELQAAVDFATKGKLDARRWTSTNPTLHNHWTIRAFDRLLGYTSRLPDFKHDVSD